MKTHMLIRTFAAVALAVCVKTVMAGDVVKPEPAGDVKPVQDRPYVAKAQLAAPATQPSDQAAAPTTQPAAEVAKATVTPDAQIVVDEVAAAYAKLKSLELAGVFTGQFETVGLQRGGTVPFTATFQSPNKYRHSGTDDVLIGSDGQKAYAYGAADKVYGVADAPKDKVAAKDLPIGFGGELATVDPSLLLAVAKDPGAELTDGVKEISKIEDTKIGETSCPTLKLTLNDKASVVLAIDPSTHLIRRANLDLRALLEGDKKPAIKAACYSVDYTTITPDAPVKEEQFAWAAPVGSKDVKELKDAPGDDDSPAMALVGKGVPDFKLTGLDGKTVSNGDLKGQVYILDFWATWCPPCRASLPHLAELYQAEKAAGLKVFAVNVKEEKQTVADFVEKTKLDVPILLDADGKASESFMANAIPETVIVGKDGKVAKVLIGFSPDETPAMLKAAVEAAMKK